MDLFSIFPMRGLKGVLQSFGDSSPPPPPSSSAVDCTQSHRIKPGMCPLGQASDHEKHLFSSPLSSEGVGMNHSGRRCELKELGRSTRFPSISSTSLHPTLPRHTFIVLVLLSILFYASIFFHFLCSCLSAQPEQRLDLEENV